RARGVRRGDRGAPERPLPGLARGAARRRGRGVGGCGGQRLASRSTRVAVAMSQRIRVNPIACDAHGLCVELLPELIRLDDWGYPMIDDSRVAPELVGLAKMAADACPTLALVLEQE